MLSISNIKLGTIFQENNEPYEVISAQHVQMGRGGAILRLKVKNLLSGHVFEKTLKGSDALEEADLSRGKASFLYADEKELYFMKSDTYEQFSIDKKSIGNKTNFLKEGIEVTVLNFNQQPVSVDLPVKMDFKVTSAPPGIRGDSAQGRVFKEITIETGYKLDVPLFIKEGDTIRINTDTGKYAERV